MTKQLNWLFIVILVLGAFLRLFHFTEMKRNNPIFDIPIVDSAEYVKLAEYYIDKNLLGPSFSYWHPPLYSYFVACIFRIFGKSVDIIKIFQIIIDLVNMLLIYFIAKKIFARKIAIISIALYSLYIPIIFYCTELLPPILIIFLLLISVYSLFKHSEYQNNDKYKVRWLIYQV